MRTVLLRPGKAQQCSMFARSCCTGCRGEEARRGFRLVPAGNMLQYSYDCEGVWWRNSLTGVNEPKPKPLQHVFPHEVTECLP
jgi:hypothetical protein